MAEIFIAIPHHAVASHPHAAIDLKYFLESRFVGIEFRIEPQTRFECRLVGTEGTGAQLHQVTAAAQEWLGKH
ncbi:MAG: hypothetical protein J0H14_07155 [Alphaproteobacteria bacterium]|nr:hypothetical protein [Alphaproteobacteria bacterium]